MSFIEALYQGAKYFQKLEQSSEIAGNARRAREVIMNVVRLLETGDAERMPSLSQADLFGLKFQGLSKLEALSEQQVDKTLIGLLLIDGLRGQALRAVLAQAPKFTKEDLEEVCEGPYSLLQIAFMQLRGEDLNTFFERCESPTLFKVEDFTGAQAQRTLRVMKTVFENLRGQDLQGFFKIHCEGTCEGTFPVEFLKKKDDQGESLLHHALVCLNVQEEPQSQIGDFDFFLELCPDLNEALLTQRAGDGYRVIDYAFDCLRGVAFELFLERCPKPCSLDFLQQKENKENETVLHSGLKRLPEAELRAFLKYACERFAAPTPISIPLSETVLDHQDKHGQYILHDAIMRLEDLDLRSFLKTYCPASFSATILKRQNASQKNLLHTAAEHLRGTVLVDFLAKCPEEFSLELLSQQDNRGNTVLQTVFKHLRGEDLQVFMEHCPDKFTEAYLKLENKAGENILHTALLSLKGADWECFLAHCPDKFTEAFFVENEKGRKSIFHTAVEKLEGTDLHQFFAHCRPLTEELLDSRNRVGENVLEAFINKSYSLYAIEKFLSYCWSYPSFKIESLVKKIQATHSYFKKGKETFKTYAKILLRLMCMYLNAKCTSEKRKEKDSLLRVFMNVGQDGRARQRDFSLLLKAMHAQQSLPKGEIRPGLIWDNYNKLRARIVHLYQENKEIMQEAITESTPFLGNLLSEDAAISPGSGRAVVPVALAFGSTAAGVGIVSPEERRMRWINQRKGGQSTGAGGLVPPHHVSAEDSAHRL